MLYVGRYSLFAHPNGITNLYRCKGDANVGNNGKQRTPHRADMGLI